MADLLRLCLHSCESVSYRLANCWWGACLILCRLPCLGVPETRSKRPTREKTSVGTYDVRYRSLFPRAHSPQMDEGPYEVRPLSRVRRYVCGGRGPVFGNGRGFGYPKSNVILKLTKWSAVFTNIMRRIDQVLYYNKSH